MHANYCYGMILGGKGKGPRPSFTTLQSEPRCEGCGMLGHRRRDCETNSRPKGVHLQDRTANKLAWQRRSEADMICTRCNAKGHSAPNCKVEFCVRCAEFGHASEDCATKGPVSSADAVNARELHEHADDNVCWECHATDHNSSECPFREGAYQDLKRQKTTVVRDQTMQTARKDAVHMADKEAITQASDPGLDSRNARDRALRVYNHTSRSRVQEERQRQRNTLHARVAVCEQSKKRKKRKKKKKNKSSKSHEGDESLQLVGYSSGDD